MTGTDMPSQVVSCHWQVLENMPVFCVLITSAAFHPVTHCISSFLTSTGMDHLMTGIYSPIPGVV